jgi:hypothetical protein
LPPLWPPSGSCCAKSVYKEFSYDDLIALAEPDRGKNFFGLRSEFLNLVRLAKSTRTM